MSAVADKLAAVRVEPGGFRDIWIDENATTGDPVGNRLGNTGLARAFCGFSP